MLVSRSCIAAALGKFSCLGSARSSSAYGAKPTAQPSSSQKTLRGISVYKFDLYVFCGQNLAEQLTQSDFLPLHAAVGANTVGGTARQSTLKTLPQNEFEVPRDQDIANPAVLKLSDHLVWIGNRRVVRT